MPGGDRTGPLGKGPMTGRRLGNCVDADVPAGTFGRRFYGRGYRRGQGAGWGFRNQYHGGIAESREDDPSSYAKINALEEEIRKLKEQFVAFGKKSSQQDRED